jgi:ankyrin repeat protein/L-ascorbate metabolism protein UlaG (beta-lactamase superfamily)
LKIPFLHSLSRWYNICTFVLFVTKKKKHHGNNQIYNPKREGIVMKKVLTFVLLFSFATACFADAIHDAAIEGDLEKMKELIAADPNLLDSKDETGYSLLHLAAYRGYMDIVQYLVENGMDTNVRSGGNSTPLHGAGVYGHLKVVKYLIENGAEIDTPNQGGFTPLLSSAAGGQGYTVHYLIGKGADVNAKTQQGINALMIASQNSESDVDFAKSLINLGLSVDEVDNYGRQAISIAASTNRADLIELYVEHGADVNFTPEDGWSPLLYSVARQSKEATFKLIELGADVHVVNSSGFSLFYLAVKEGDLEVVGRLIEKGIDINLQETNFGYSPLNFASIGGNIDIVNLLLESNADYMLADNEGVTPIQYAARYGHKEIVDLLKAKGASATDLVENYEFSPLLEQKIGNGDAHVWYLGHTAYAVKTKKNLMVFDYWKPTDGPTNQLLANGHINPEEIKDCDVTVFVSHQHTDHFSPVIFGWDDVVENITYVYGFNPEDFETEEDDCSCADNACEHNSPEFTVIKPHEYKKINGMKIHTLAANDAGVGFLVDVDGIQLYHAGDHAGWRDNEKDGYTSEIDYISQYTKNLDFAFVNVTGCHANGAVPLREGTVYMIDKLNPAVVFPTHAFRREYIYKMFGEHEEFAQYLPRYYSPRNCGDFFYYVDGKIKNGATETL